MGLYDLACKTFISFDCLCDKLFRNGCDFGGRIPNSELGIEVSHGNEYQPVMGGFARAFKPLEISGDDSIIDIGCGKGKAMWILSKLGFGLISGYDLSEELVKIANNNFDKIGQANKCKAFVSDAMDFADYDKYNYIFMNNAVPRFVFEKTIDNILDSVHRNPRRCIFVYGNKTCEDYLEKTGAFKELYTYKNPLHYMVNYSPMRLLCDRSGVQSFFTFTCYEINL